MTGSLQQKNGYYYVLLNKKNKDGKRKVEWVSTGLPIKGNKAKAEKFRMELLQKETAMEGLDQVKAEELFVTYMKRWLLGSAIRLDPVTYEGYRQVAESRIIPYFEPKKLKLKNLSRGDIQDYVNYLYTDGRVKGEGGLSPKSIRDHMCVLRQVCNTAVRDNIIAKNPCEYVDLPKMVKPETDFYTYEELQELFRVAKDEEIYPVLYFTVIYGLRRSEVLGIKWDSVDFERNILTIKHTVVLQNNIYKKDTTKNKSSHRSYPLTDDTRKLLLELKSQEELNRKKYGKDYIENDYVFKWPNGDPFRPDYISHRFKKIQKHHELRDIRFHDLRHSCASYLISQGYNLKVISEWLGHSDIQMTANIYGHIDARFKQSVANEMSDSFKF